MNAKELGNQPAHPTVREYVHGAGTGVEHIEGMTKREAFAMAAMQGFISQGHSGQGFAERIAIMSTNCADALLERLSQ